MDADKIYVMDHGKVVMEGTPKEIFSQVEKLKSYRLDVPQVTILADSGAVFKVEDQKYNNRKDISEGSLYLMKDGKGTRITDEADLAEIAYLGANRVLYISDGDLRLWTGKDSEKLASDVNTFWVNNVAGSETYYCYFG